MSEILFVSGIDTDAGKSYATAYLAKTWNEAGIKTITQKFIQTGNVGRSEDIELHRKIMGSPMLQEDMEHLTAPEIFSYPASPLLASKIDNRPIDFKKMEAATAELANRYERVLLEGAGGLMVPLCQQGDHTLLTIDYVAQKGYPLVFVSSGKLGSVNHTLLSLEAIRHRNIQLKIFAYNTFPQPEDKTIQEDTRTFLQNELKRTFPAARWVDIPLIKI